MDEIKRTLDVLKKIALEDKDHRKTSLGRLLSNSKDELSFESFDVYFNRNAKKEQIDIQVGECTFNFGEWSSSLHKLAEMLLLKGARVEDMESLGSQHDSFTRSK